MSPDQLAHLVSTYGYIAIFPFAVIEGPILTVIGGFLVSLKLLNPVLVYIVVVAGDIVGDSGCYVLGRFGQPLIHRWGHTIGLTRERLEDAKDFFHERHHKAVAASKLLHGIGWTGLVAAGVLRIPYLRFARTCALISIAQSFALLLVGIFFGHAYLAIGEYLNYFAGAISIITLMIILVLVLRKLKSGAQRGKK